MRPTKLIDSFQEARNDSGLAVIEGVQALKHAARFNADFTHIVSSDIQQLTNYLEELAPDIINHVISQSTEIEETTFLKLSPQPPRTRVIATAKRSVYSLDELDSMKPIVLLENPRDLENIGAAIRVSAAADIAAVCITGDLDIWHPAIIRGAAGLHFALPVCNVTLSEVQQLGRRIVALDPTGEDISNLGFPKNSVFLFGTERHGISKESLELSNMIARLPMKAGVSSLNLATSVAATLYSNIKSKE